MGGPYAEGATTLTRAFFDGRPRAPIYLAAMRQLEPIYRALEASLVVESEHYLLSPFHRPELFRTPSIRADLRALGSAGNRAQTRCTQDHTRRIFLVARHQPGRLIGHLYALHITDLVAARVVGPWAARALGFEEHTRLNFLHYPCIGDLGAYREELHAYLDAVPRAAHDGIVQEAVLAFSLRGRLLTELLSERDGQPGIRRRMPARGPRTPPRVLMRAEES